MPRALPPRTASCPPEELLQFLASYRVVVCTACRYAIQPKAIARHLKDIHRIKSSERQSYLDHVGRYELAEHEFVMQFTPGQFPVPLLPVQNGLQCQSEDCAYLCATEKRMKHHWSSVHGRNGFASRDWRSTPIQTFFKGNLLRYFTGRLSNQPEEHLSSDSLSATPTSTSSLRTLSEAENLLMNHFTSHTCLTLASNEIGRQVWSDVVPNLAHQHEFLMHALLACSALHMAASMPDQRFELIIKARTHQSYAMPLFRAAVPKVEDKTCDPILAFARLVAINAFALDGQSLVADEKEDNLPSWFFFSRNGCTMLCEFWGRIGTGPVRALADSWEVLVHLVRRPHQPILDFLLAIVPQDWAENVQGPYRKSALALARNFSCLDALDEVTPLDVVRFWPVQNCDDFLELLSQWHPGALILLTHYCIILHRIGRRVWYLENVPTSIMAIIMRRLDPRWHQYIEWPLREIGWTRSMEERFEDLSVTPLILLNDLMANFDSGMSIEIAH